MSGRDTLPTRLLSRIDVRMGGCWYWTGALDPRGYGRVYVADRKMGLAHRVSYELLVGPIPDGLTLDHLCRTKHCVNPLHLDPVTAIENYDRQPRSTYCKNGHELAGANLYLHTRKEGQRRPARRCRICTLEQNRQWRLRRAEGRRVA